MKLFLLFVFALAALAREDFLSNVLEEVLEERMAAETPVGFLFGTKTGLPPGGVAGRRQLAPLLEPENRLSDILEELIEKRMRRN